MHERMVRLAKFQTNYKLEKIRLFFKKQNILENVSKSFTSHFFFLLEKLIWNLLFGVVLRFKVKINVSHSSTVLLQARKVLMKIYIVTWMRHITVNAREKHGLSHCSQDQNNCSGWVWCFKMVKIVKCCHPMVFCLQWLDPFTNFPQVLYIMFQKAEHVPSTQAK